MTVSVTVAPTIPVEADVTIIIPVRAAQAINHFLWEYISNGSIPDSTNRALMDLSQQLDDKIGPPSQDSYCLVGDGGIRFVQREALD